MRKLFFLLKLLASSMLATSAFAADEYPTVGIVYNTKEDHSISYDCKRIAPNYLECNFIQTAVRKATDVTTLAERMSAAQKEFKNKGKNSVVDKKSCEIYNFILEVVGGNRSSAELNLIEGVDDKEKLIAAIDRTKSDIHLKRIITALKNFCDSQTEKNFLDIVRSQHERDLKTCKISSNAFSQKFKLASDHSDKIVWIVDSRPEGVCGIVQLSRFERFNQSGIQFWRYFAKKSIANPGGTILGMSCSHLDENEYLYDWRQNRNDNLGCEYVEFSP